MHKKVDIFLGTTLIFVRGNLSVREFKKSNLAEFCTWKRLKKLLLKINFI